MRQWRSLSVAVFAVLALLGSAAQAASISYVLDQSNADPLLPDGAPWLQVTLADGASGTIDFTVDILPRLTGIADAGFGLRSFAFSSQGAADILFGKNVLGLPAGWSVTFGSSVGNFGSFDVLLQAGAAAAVTPRFTFSIGGVSGDTIADYAVLSRGRATEGRVYFAALVGGLQDQDPGRKTLAKAWFGGSQPMPVVPLPGAAWLLASAVASLSLYRRRGQVRFRRGSPAQRAP